MSKFNLDRTVYYFRVSSSNQAERENTLSHYISRATNVGFTQEQIFFDVGSGTTADRENYRKIKEMALRNEIDAIILPNDLSRLTRNIVEFQVIKELLLETGVKLLNISGDEYKFETPEEELHGNLQLSFYQYEAKRNKAKSIAGHNYLRKMGKCCKATFPYLKVDGYLEPNLNPYGNFNISTWDVGRQLIKRYLQDGSLTQTLRDMTEKYSIERVGHNKWDDYTRADHRFREWLLYPVLRGHTYYRVTNETKFDTHQALITPEEDESIRQWIKIASRSTKKKGGGQSKNLWKSILFCGNCGYPMAVHNNNGHYYLKCTEAYVRTASRVRLRKQGLETPKCNHSSAYKLTASKLEKLTIEALMTRAEDIANSLKEDRSPTIIIPPEILTLQDDISKLEILSQTMSGLDSVIKQKQLELNKLKAKHSQNDDAALIVRRNKLKEYGKNYDFWSEASFQDKLYLFNQFIERIDCYKGVPKFTFSV